MKVKLAALFALCQGKGYTGAEDDVVAMKGYLADQKISIKDSSGKAVDIAALEVIKPEPSGSVAVLDLEPDSKSRTGDGDPPDFGIKLDAALNDRLKRMGLLDAAGRPKPINDAPKVEVKSGYQLRYEDMVKRGQSAYRSWDTAYAALQKSIADYAHINNRPDLVAKAREKLDQHCKAKGYVTTSTAGGGALVPEQVEMDLINLVKDYGVARKYARVVNMESDRCIRPRVTGTHIVSYPQEAGTISSSTQTFSNVQLVAKTGHVLVQLSNQIIDDAAIDIVDHATREGARAIALIEDCSLFNADGSGPLTTATTGQNPIGFIPNTLGLTSINTDSADGQRTIIGGATASAHALTDLAQTMGLLPSYARANAMWHCTGEMNALVLLRLAQSQGGVTLQEFAGSGYMQTVFGRPVAPNNVMNITDAASANTTDVIFGDLSLGCMFGDRKGIEVAVSNERYFDSYQTALRISVRHDVVVHDIGTSTTQSPIVFLKQS